MKRLQLTFIILAGAALASCQWDEKPDYDAAVYTDTLVYNYKTIHDRAVDCRDKDDTTCTHVDIQYPEFVNSPKLNDSISAKLINMFAMYNNGKPNTNLVAYSKEFINNYVQFKQQNPEVKMYFELENYAKVLHQDSALVSLEVGGYTFQGGAHGASYTGFINWNTKTNAPITLDEILVDGYIDTLNSVAEKIFREQEKLGPNEPLGSNYFFKDDKFALNNNYSISPIGLRFVYNQYEIKPYAAGQTDLFIPYNKIESIIRPHTVVSTYLK